MMVKTLYVDMLLHDEHVNDWNNDRVLKAAFNERLDVEADRRFIGPLDAHLKDTRCWHAATLDADHWSALGDVAPIDAAMLLSRFNPNETSYDDARLTTTDELRPEHFVRLAQRLADIDKAEHKPRTLREWHQTAQDLGLTYHSWIDGYMEATPPPASLVAGTAPPEPQAAPAGVTDAVKFRDRGNVMQKRALLAKYGNLWESMDSCFKNAHANGLHKAAKSKVRGEWFEADAVAWAKKQGNMKDTNDSVSTSLESAWTART